MCKFLSVKSCEHAREAENIFELKIIFLFFFICETVAYWPICLWILFTHFASPRFHLRISASIWTWGWVTTDDHWIDATDMEMSDDIFGSLTLTRSSTTWLATNPHPHFVYARETSHTNVWTCTCVSEGASQFFSFLSRVYIFSICTARKKKIRRLCDQTENYKLIFILSEMFDRSRGL